LTDAAAAENDARLWMTASVEVVLTSAKGVLVLDVAVVAATGKAHDISFSSKPSLFSLTLSLDGELSSLPVAASMSSLQECFGGSAGN
jgi:hypothetical protein